jgi:rhamnosyltransferase
MRICAVIVTFNPDERLVKNVERLLTQVDTVIIVDNASVSKDFLQGFAGQVETILNSRNAGLATALNQGVKKALELNAHWIITFDQDSVAPPTFVRDLLASYKACPYQEQIAIIAPVYKDQVSGVVTSHAVADESNLYRPVLRTLTSGALTKARVFQEIGLFKDAFFIDYIDTEYCLRCVKHSYKLIEAPGAVLLHNLGQPEPHRLLGKVFYATNYSPVRRYYNARNRVIVYKNYWHLQPKWVLQDLYSFSVEVVKMLVAEQERPRKMSHTLKGVWHGLIGKEGPHA